MPRLFKALLTRVVLTFGFLLILFVALSIYGVYVVVGWPTWGQPWSTAEDWARLGTLLAGLGTLFLAITALVGTALALYQYRQQRDRDLDQRRRQNLLDRARLQGDVVVALRLRYELATGREGEKDLRQELEREAHRSQAFLEGALVADSELATLFRKAITARLAEATEELERRRSAQTAGSP